MSIGCSYQRLRSGSQLECWYAFFSVCSFKGTVPFKALAPTGGSAGGAGGGGGGGSGGGGCGLGNRLNIHT